MKITKLHLEELRNEAHYQALLLTKKLIDENPTISSIVSQSYTEFNSLLQLEGTLVDQVRKSGYTAELAETDARLDRDIVGLNSAIDAALHHFDPETVKAAKTLEVLMKSFRGEIEKKAYEEESGAVKILVRDLQTTYATQVSYLNFNSWVTEIDSAQQEFERLFLLRNDELADRPHEKLKTVRKEIDAVYRRMVEQIDAYTVLNGDASTEPFVRRINEEIVYFNEHTHHHAKKDIAKAAVNNIADQVYAGKPVVLIPEVFDEDKELVFSQDFELSYKNNNAVGTADVIIHGKGAFKGKKIVSFNIVHNPNEK
jgi:hypothetical protein